MLTGFEALGAASAVLQVISFATDVAVALKNAYEGATASEDDLHRHAKEMSEAVERVNTRCGQMNNTNSSFNTPELKNISQDCRVAAKKLETEVSYVTSLQARGDIVNAFRKAFRTSRRKKKLEDLEKTLFRYKQLIDIELKSHLCSRSEAVRLKQESAFQKLDTDVQSLVNQLAQGVTDVQNLVKQEHSTTRTAITQETTRVEVAINSHTDSQVLELRIAAETEKKCETFLQSLKAPRMNQRYNDVMDSRDASFNQVFASYEDMRDMYYGYSDDDDDPEGDDLEDDADLEDCDNSDCISHMNAIHRSWTSFNSWLQSDDQLFYIQGKPGSGKSTLVKFILDQNQTHDLAKRWSADATILSYFFWKIGSEEQNSIKGLWCSLLYQRLQGQQHLILSTLQHFSHLSLHSEYHDWSIKDLQAVWVYVANLDTRHICIFVDGLDEIRDQDGFSKLAPSIQSISRLPKTKLCVSTRPEAQIMRWLKATKAAGILLEDLTRFDMFVFVRQRFCELLPNSQISLKVFNDLRQQLVDKAQGVFLWLHLATRSIIEGIENEDSEKILFSRLRELPGDLEKLYVDMWERFNAKSSVYQETARRYFRYVLHSSNEDICIGIVLRWRWASLPLTLQIACAENTGIQQNLLTGTGTIGVTEILRMCDETKASIHSRCAGLLEVQPQKLHHNLSEKLGDNSTAFSQAFGNVAFIHRTAHDFLTDTEAGQGILRCDLLSDFPWQTRLLKGLICMVIVLASEWDLLCDSSHIINQITDPAKRRGSEGLQLATEMLDVIRPLFNKHLLRHYIYPWEPQLSFLSHLISDELFDDYVISCLTTETSPHLATSVLREGWYSGLDVKLRKSMFDALIVLGADPHEYGVLGDSSEMEPFVMKGTAFTNLLTYFLISTQNGFDHGDIEHSRTLEIAIHMATTCQDLNAAVALFASFSETGYMEILSSNLIIDSLSHTSSTLSLLVVYEVNLQFLLLYLLSKIGGNLADSVLASLQAQDVLSKIDNPSVKLRYFQRLKVTEDNLEQDIASPMMFQRVVPVIPSLLGSDIEHLFDVDFRRPSQELCMPHEDKTYLHTISRYIKDIQTEEVEVEDMVTSLAAENLGFCTYEKAGITPTYEYLRTPTESNVDSWRLFPLAMGRLKAAAATKEGTKGHEPLP
ncbi:uncharacterized protein BKA55DRAFT_596672 [Fusarium redolens]|uniref:NACHT domain-containing protein n=1 Tax=Fusarium redolens TaxID=48865 RepID=A0A9P9GK98_FUSRE|nr:uncharacterized protein BKA55DRAFT_596672 [Fusarium redolens]KAH7240047.1 hypothetical protein BKA55DRAFT_596672 [Fusarium redolens]